MDTPRALRHRRWLAAVAVCALVALPTGALAVAQSPAAASPRVDLGPAGPWVLVAPAFLPSASDVPLGPLPAELPVHVIVAIARTDPAGLDAAIARTYIPGTPEFHHFLTPTQVADQFGPTAGSYAQAVGYFRWAGLSVQTSPDRTVLLVGGPSVAVGNAFHTMFERYARGTGWFFSHSDAARLPAGIPWAGAVGLGNATPIRPLAGPLMAPRPVAAPSASPCPPTPFGVSPCEARYVYNVSGFANAGINGTGSRIGIVDTYDGSESQSNLQSDLRQFASLYALPYGNVSWVYPVPTKTNLNQTFNIWGLEEALDLEWSRAMAPGASIDMTFAPDSTYGLYAAVDYLVAHHAVDVLTMSWGEPDVGIFNAFSGACVAQCNASSDGSYEILHPVLQAAAAEGISVFSSSGDCGAASGTSGVATSYPASDPYVTGVGGTNLGQNSSGGWGSESGWSGNSTGATAPGCGNQGGSGGGWSPFARPWWQTGPNLTGGPRLRGQPDVSALAGSPGVPIVLGGNNGTEGGTSLSSPMWAGMAAIADQRAGTALGFLNPVLYSIARNASHRTAFHDITRGWNGYFAGPGWDPVTGLGTPNGAVLLPLLSSSAVPNPGITVNLTATPRFGAAPLTATFHASATGGQRPYSFYDVSFGDGNSTATRTGDATHRYLTAGVYAATAEVFDAASNSSLSQPLAVVVGGGGSLNVTLNVTPLRPAVGAPVALKVIVSGGLAPYTFHYAFGDGTYLDSNRSLATHAYAPAGAYCAAVIVGDARRPPDGAAAPSVGVGVGAVAPPNCTTSQRLRASFSATPPAADLPGDLAFSANVSGGMLPYSVQYTSDDPYVQACQCGIFSVRGVHNVTGLVSDSGSLQANGTFNVTLYPRLSGHFTVNRSTGPAPLSVRFSDTAVAGGHGNPLVIAAGTRWSFGDGTNATGQYVSHAYVNSGAYVAVGSATDLVGGTTSEAFLILVRPSGAVVGPFLSANVTPAVDVPAGTMVALTAQASPGSLIHWALAPNDSAFGPFVGQTFAYSPCRAQGTCPLPIALAIQDPTGAWTNVSMPLRPAVRGNATALTLNYSTTTASQGITPFPWAATANASGIPSPRIAWTFGDGSNATGPTASHTYLAPGNFTVTVTATDPFGDRLLRSHAVVVYGVPRIPPTVVGGPNRTGGIAPLSVAFDAVASGGGGGPYTYAWTFGDGWHSTANATTHVYAMPGQFLANLTVRDRIGSPTLATFPIGVYNVTAVGFDVLGWNVSLPPNQAVRLSIRVLPVCRLDSLPGCAANPVPFRVAVLTAGAPPPTGSSTGGVGSRAGALNWTNITLTTPATAGSYVLYLWTYTPGYSGSSTVAFTVRTIASTPGGGWMLSPFALLALAAGVAIAVAIWIGVFLGRRHRRRPMEKKAEEEREPTPSRRRGAGGGRRGG